jgi:hypothetical protein
VKYLAAGVWDYSENALIIENALYNIMLFLRAQYIAGVETVET